MGRSRRAEFLREIIHFKSGNESEKFSAIQALRFRFPDYDELGGIALEYLSSHQEIDQERGLRLFNQLLGSGVAKPIELSRLKEIFEENLVCLKQGKKHQLLEDAFYALCSQGICQGLRYREELRSIVSTSVMMEIAPTRCLYSIGDRHGLLEAVLNKEINYEVVDFICSYFGEFARYRKIETVLSRLSAIFPNMLQLGGLSEFLSDYKNLVEAVDDLPDNGVGGFPERVWKPMRALSSRTNVGRLATDRELISAARDVVFEHPTAEKDHRRKLKKICRNLNFLSK